MGTVATDIHTEIGTQYTTTHTLSFLETWGRGDSSYGYTYGDRDTIYHHPYTLIFGDLGDVGTVPKDIHPEIGTQYTTPIYSHFWRLGDVGTVPKDIHTEIETQYITPTDIHTEIGTQYTTPIHSHFWRLGDLGTVPKDIHTEIETQYTTPRYTLIFGDFGTWGQYLRI